MEGKRYLGNRHRWLVAVALISLAVVLSIFASQLDLTKEPAWLADLTPVQHFLVHALFFLCGIVFGVSGLLLVIGRVPRLTKQKKHPLVE